MRGMDTLITRLISGGTEEVVMSRQCQLPGAVLHPGVVVSSKGLEMLIHKVVIDIDSGWTTVECDPWSLSVEYYGKDHVESRYRDAVERHLAAGFKVERTNVDARSKTENSS
jgi:hypothetical protein